MQTDDKKPVRCPVCGKSVDGEDDRHAILSHGQCYACYEQVRVILEDPDEMNYGYN